MRVTGRGASPLLLHQLILLLLEEHVHLGRHHSSTNQWREPLVTQATTIIVAVRSRLLHRRCGTKGRFGCGVVRSAVLGTFLRSLLRASPKSATACWEHRVGVSQRPRGPCTRTGWVTAVCGLHLSCRKPIDELLHEFVIHVVRGPALLLAILQPLAEFHRAGESVVKVAVSDGSSACTCCNRMSNESGGRRPRAPHQHHGYDFTI